MKPPAQKYPAMPFKIEQNDLAYAGLIAVGLVLFGAYTGRLDAGNPDQAIPEHMRTQGES